jgi:hypothetical protein|tara:strand:- start:2375 stop:2521 length:147 start_codon:yes stop_codon:yes gene_type:complete
MAIKKVPSNKSFEKQNPREIGKNIGVTGIVNMKGKGAAKKGLKFKVRN